MEISFAVNGDIVRSPEENVELRFQLSNGIKLINRPSEMPTNPSVTDMVTELENCSEQLWGKRLCKNNEQSSYR
jgi:hypothetical protein